LAAAPNAQAQLGVRWAVRDGAPAPSAVGHHDQVAAAGVPDSRLAVAAAASGSLSVQAAAVALHAVVAQPSAVVVLVAARQAGQWWALRAAQGSPTTRPSCTPADARTVSSRR